MTNHVAIAEKYMLLIFLFYYSTSKNAKTAVQGWLWYLMYYLRNNIMCRKAETPDNVNNVEANNVNT